MNGVSLSTRGFVSPVTSVSSVIPLAPQSAQKLLVKALSIPVSGQTTLALGIHQSDVIIRSAIIAGIANLRAEPWLLDYCFASLPQDALTRSDYGEKEVQNAKNWFLQTDIPVIMDYTQIQGAVLPCISIKLASSEETENTLGDIHYDTQEETEANWPILLGPFTPLFYSAATGTIKLPPIAADQVVLNTDMYVIDSVGRSYEITEIVSDNTIKIKAGIVADFSRTTIRHKKPLLLTKLESVAFRESYRLGIHTSGEPVHLTYLHSIMTFVLLAYKEVLLEARGFERSVISSSDFIRNESFDTELAHSRFITITGSVRNYWPKSMNSRIQGMGGQFAFGAVGNESTDYVTSGESDDEAWLTQDSIGKVIR